MSEPRFKVGDRVNTERWDRYVPPARRINGATVTGVQKQRSESGWVVKLDKYPGWLDQNWLELELRLEK